MSDDEMVMRCVLQWISTHTLVMILKGASSGSPRGAASNIDL